FDGEEEIPRVKTTSLIPTRLVSFTEAISAKDHSGFVVFYEHDEKIERLWKNPNRYLPILKRFDGVITPDYSLYYDMPYAMQVWNTYRGKAVGAWLNDNDIPVIPNVRWGDERSLELSCKGVEINSTIAIGTHGCIKSLAYKQLFTQGLDYVIQKLTPKNVIVYGRAPDRIFSLAKMFGVNVLSFESNFGLSHKKEVI
ncbi:MAG: DUF4417 domain-containing protein, partial [Firmicutes bacterium]|nr:DUF4417 domain-containing protein [Bacillota bacterium]